MYLNVPAVSPREWHPFTIASTPPLLQSDDDGDGAAGRKGGRRRASAAAAPGSVTVLVRSAGDMLVGGLLFVVNI